MPEPRFGPNPNPKGSCDHYAYDAERCLRCGAVRKPDPKPKKEKPDAHCLRSRDRR